MAANDTAALVVALSAQLTQFEKDMTAAGDIADRGVRNIENKFKSANIEIGGLNTLTSKLEGLLTAGGVLVAIDQLKQLNEQVAKIGEGAQRVGLSTDAFQKFRFAVIETGGSVEGADQFLDTFSRKIAEAATGTGALYNFLRANNVALKDSNGQLLPLTTLLGKYADLVKNTKSPQDQLNETFLAGGRGAASMVAVLKEGADGLRKFGDDAERAGTIIDQSLIDRAVKANAQFQILKLRVQTVFEEAALAAVDALQKNNAEFERIGKGYSETIKKAWDEALAYIVEHNPDVGRIIQNLRDTLSNVPITEGGSVNRRGSDINSPIFGRTDPRLNLASTTSGDNSTRQYDALGDAFTKLIAAQEKRTELLQAEADSVGKTVGAETTYKTAILLENEAIEKNIPLTAARFAEIQASAQKSGAAAQALDDYKRAWAGLNSAAQFAGDQLIGVLDGLRTKTLSLSQAANQLANSLIHALEQAALLGSGPLASVLGAQSNVPGGTGGLIGALLGGFRAGGGPVYAGRSYIVGENGPELFSPDSSGQITPNNLLSGSSQSGPVITYAPMIDARGADAAAVTRLAAALANDQRTFETRVKSTVSKWRSNTPGAF